MTTDQSSVTGLTTQRLLLRGWTDADRDPWAAMNADPEVMRYFPSTRSRADSDAALEEFQGLLTRNGYGLWAVEVRATGDFIGFVGLNPTPDDYPVAPATEIGWRLARSSWGRGYATEAARAVLAHAFGPLGFTELVSFTTVTNTPSRNVMEKIGMTYDPADDFENPSVKGWWGAPHVVYRLSADRYRTTAS
jgi:RimJ/RimL family protein N-acetyltransferase